MDKRMFKKTGEELQQYLAFKRKGSKVESKKGQRLLQATPEAQRKGS